MILVDETSDDDKSDTIYINEVIKKFFDSNGVNLQFVHLNGKQNYNNKKIVSKIRNYTKMFKKFAGGDTATIYFIDTDSTSKSFKPGSFFHNLTEFGKENGFELVWFCKNAENVFLNVEPDQIENKTQAAIDFVSDCKIDKIDKEKLKKQTIEPNCSNVLFILSKYLKEK